MGVKKRHNSSVFRLYLASSVVCFLSFLPAVAFAQQTRPDAGTLERQLRQDSMRLPEAAPVPQTKPAEIKMKGETVKVVKFLFKGETKVSEDELDAVVAGYVGRTLTLSELEGVTQKISDYYYERGFFARCYLPAQDVTYGLIHIEIVEGRLGEVIFQGDSKRADHDYLRKVVIGDVNQGELYSAKRLERGLLIANDMPGISANGVLSAGKDTGLSNFTLLLEDRPIITGEASVNNYGTKATDEYQASAGVSANNLNGKGDQLTLRALGSKNLGYGQLGYSVPIGTEGLIASVDASYLQYQLGDTFSALDAEGSAYTLGTHASYPVLRTDKYSLWANLGYEYRNYDDDILGVPLARKSMHVVSSSVNGQAVDSFFGGGDNRYSVTLSIGDLDLSGEPASFAADMAGPRTDGAFGKLNLTLNRDQLIGTNSWYLRKRFFAQLAANNLDSSEKFALGGPYGIRAYPVNEALGDDGAMLNVEMHKLINAWDLYGFIDAGAIRQYSDTWAGWNPTGDAHNNYWLAGAGVGAGYVITDHVKVNGTLAVPLGSHAGESAKDRNQDGSKQGPRLWGGLTTTF